MNQEVIHEYFYKVLNHVRENTHHASLKHRRRIAEAERHTPICKRAKRTCEGSLLLVLWCIGI